MDLGATVCHCLDLYLLSPRWCLTRSGSFQPRTCSSNTLGEYSTEYGSLRPSIPITVNMGMKFNGWYDVLHVRQPGWQDREDEAGILMSVGFVNELISKEIQDGIPSERIVLVGHSQGGAVSLLTGLTSVRKLGGIAVLSSYLMCRERITTTLSPYAIDLPIFLAHGQNDDMVPISRAQLTYNYMVEKYGIKLAEAKEPAKGGITLRVFNNMGHEINEEQETEQLAWWLAEIIPRS